MTGPGRKLGLALVLGALLAALLSACFSSTPTFDGATDTAPLVHATLISDGTDRYLYSRDGASLAVSSPATNTGGQLRQVFYPADGPVTADEQSSRDVDRADGHLRPAGRRAAHRPHRRRPRHPGRHRHQEHLGGRFLALQRARVELGRGPPVQAARHGEHVVGGGARRVPPGADALARVRPGVGPHLPVRGVDGQQRAARLGRRPGRPSRCACRRGGATRAVPAGTSATSRAATSTPSPTSRPGHCTTRPPHAPRASARPIPRGPPQLPEPDQGQRAMPTYFMSRYSSMPSWPPSRPSPDCLTPPNGAAGFDTTPWLMPDHARSRAPSPDAERPRRGRG